MRAGDPLQAVVDEPGLADPGLTADDDDARSTGEQGCDRGREPGRLRLATDHQRAGETGVVSHLHGAIVRSARGDRKVRTGGHGGDVLRQPRGRRARVGRVAGGHR